MQALQEPVAVGWGDEGAGPGAAIPAPPRGRMAIALLSLVGVSR